MKEYEDRAIALRETFPERAAIRGAINLGISQRNLKASMLLYAWLDTLEELDVLRTELAQWNLGKFGT